MCFVTKRKRYLDEWPLVGMPPSRAPWKDAGGRDGGEEEGLPRMRTCSPSPGDRTEAEWVTH